MIAGIDESLRLVDCGLEIFGDAFAAKTRDDAEGAFAVASVLRLQISACGAHWHRRSIVFLLDDEGARFLETAGDVDALVGILLAKVCDELFAVVLCAGRDRTASDHEEISFLVGCDHIVSDR